jgi:Fe-S-cluster containining protein
MASLERFWCDALTAGKRCAVYDLRPLVCRLWGAVESMPCVYGCVPEGGYLTDMDAYRLIAESTRIGGGTHGGGAAEIDAAMARQGLRAEVERIRARGRIGEQRRARESIPAPFRRP